MQIIQDVVLYDWLNVIAKFEARTTTPSNVKSIFRFDEYTRQMTSHLAHFDFAPNML